MHGTRANPDNKAYESMIIGSTLRDVKYLFPPNVDYDIIPTQNQIIIIVRTKEKSFEVADVLKKNDIAYRWVNSNREFLYVIPRTD